MKLSKKIVCLSMIATMSLTSVSAFADYDYTMVKAEELAQKGLFYQAYAMLDKVDDKTTSAYQNLKDLVDFRIAVLENVPAVAVLPKAFESVTKLLDQGLYYQALEMLGQVKADFGNEIGNSYEYASKVDMLEKEAKIGIANWEFKDSMNKAYALYNDKLFYQAKDAVDKAYVYVADLNKEAEWNKLNNKIVYAINHIAVDPNEAIAILKRDKKIPADPDFGYEASAVYMDNELVGHTVTIYSKRAYNRGTSSTIATHFVAVDGEVD